MEGGLLLLKNSHFRPKNRSKMAKVTHFFGTFFLKPLYMKYARGNLNFHLFFETYFTMKFIDFFKSLLVADSGSLSSKRFCGLIGWFILLGCLIVATINGTDLPTSTTEFIFGTVTLLGVDSITSIWKERKDGRGRGGRMNMLKEDEPKEEEDLYEEPIDEDDDEPQEPGLLNNAKL